MPVVESPISLLIASAERGDRSAADALFAALYSELHRMAKRALGPDAVPITARDQSGNVGSAVCPVP